MSTTDRTKAGYDHFMLKEIMEQPDALDRTLRAAPEQIAACRLDPAGIRELKGVTLAACGTSYHACLAARYWLEGLARIPCQVEIASEFAGMTNFLGPQHLAVFVSQSGETGDTLAALRAARKSRCRSLALCNVAGSTLAQEAESAFVTQCGPEVGVASTKAFTAQLAALLALAVHFGEVRGSLNATQSAAWRERFALIPGWMRETLEVQKAVQSLAAQAHKRSDFIFIGRGLNFPIALEGSLKLKEVSYLHADGYAAGELRHGPMALVDSRKTVVALATDQAGSEKVLSVMREVRERGGRLAAIISKGSPFYPGEEDTVLEVPRVPEEIAPILNVVPLQFLAYYVAVLRGADVDRPRNLRKSVTES